MELITDNELAKLLKRSTQTLRNERSLGRGFPYIKIGRGFIRYDLEEVKKILNEHKIIPPNSGPEV